MYTSLEHSLYHKVLRISALVSTLVLIFVSGLFSDATARLAGQTELYLANSIGVSVGVAPTELNTLTAELSAWQRDLAAREAAIEEREIAVSLGTGTQSGMSSTLVMSLILFILLVLIVLNYALDYLRNQPQKVTNENSALA